MAVDITHRQGFLYFKVLYVFCGSHIMKYITDYCFLQQFKGRVPGVKVKPVDTTGAGDAFVGGILSILASDTNLYKVQSFIFIIVFYTDFGFL